ncbi:hypothetical protein P7C73_g3144, partial [Tremellales sp. Uapishka_1]
MHHPIPASSAFASKGLSDVSFDLPTSLGISISHPTSGAAAHSTSRNLNAGDWVSGRARWDEIKAYPGLRTNDARPRGKDVRFCMCPHGDSSELARFRRHAQFLAIDTLASPAASSSTTSSSATSPLHSAISADGASDWISTAHPSKRRKRNYRPPTEILAWWEDETGWWLLTEEKEAASQGESLSDWWLKMQGDEEGNAGLEKYVKVCETLLQVINCLRALNEKHLALVCCNPGQFFVDSDDNLKVSIVRLADVVALPGFHLSEILPFSPLSLSPLFTRDPPDDLSGDLSDIYIRKHLRYLAPETTSTRRVSAVGDIFSFGVLAYELLTGSTIDGSPDSPDEHEVDLLSDIHRHLTADIIPPLVYLEKEAALGAMETNLPPRQLSDIIMLCLAKDVDDRYHSLDALAYDILKLSRILKVNGDLQKFVVGEINAISHFVLPVELIDRQLHLAALDKAWAAISGSEGCEEPCSNQVVNISGCSGSGKSRLIENWIAPRDLSGEDCLVGFANMDEHLNKPLSSFVQVFQSLLDRVLTSPKENAKVWKEEIKRALGNQSSYFLSLLSQDYKKMLEPEKKAKQYDVIDWDNFMSAFKTWSKGLLQTFATRRRPLIVLVDDIQWMPMEEVKIWRNLLDGPAPLSNVLVLSTYRVEKDDATPTPLQSLLSIGATDIRIQPFDDNAALKFALSCLQSRVEGGGTGIASYLYSQTGGNPLYMGSLISTLVKESIIIFDFDLLIWRFDLQQLQRHVSDFGVDAYLSRLQAALPPPVRSLLQVLSCLPSAGFDIELLGKLLAMPIGSIEKAVKTAAETGIVSVTAAKTVKFTHGRQRTAAYRSISQEEMATMHQEVSFFLRDPSLRQDYIFDAANHALLAQRYGAPKESNQALVQLLVESSQKAAISASFEAAKRFLDMIEENIAASGGSKEWAMSHRDIYLSYLNVHSEVCGVLRYHEESLVKLRDMMTLCQDSNEVHEEMKIIILITRQLISSGKVVDAVQFAFKSMSKYGYDIQDPKAITLSVPRSVDDVKALEWIVEEESLTEDSMLGLIMSLLAFVAPSLYVTLPHLKTAAYTLGMSMVIAAGRPHDASAYLTSVYALAVSGTLQGLVIDEAECERDSYSTAMALAAVAAQAHSWEPISQAVQWTQQAFDLNISSGNNEMAAFVLSFQVTANLFSAENLDLDVLAKRYARVESTADSPLVGLLMAKGPLQYIENISAYPVDTDPWVMEGAIVTRADRELVGTLPAHAAIYLILSLRLAMYYGAPSEVQDMLVATIIPRVSAVAGLAYEIAWEFLYSVWEIRKGLGVKTPVVSKAYKMMVSMAKCNLSPGLSIRCAQLHPLAIEFQNRVLFMDALQALCIDPMAAMPLVESTLDTLERSGQYSHAGLLNFYYAEALLAKTTYSRLTVGYVRGAFACYKSMHAAGLCHMLNKRFPGMCPPSPPIPRLPSQAIGINTLPSQHPAPPVRSSSASTHTETDPSESTYEFKDDRLSVDSSKADSLDTLAIMRSSLALAAETDPLVLFCTLLRILCQFVRADYAAMSVCDEADPSVLHLRAAGPSGRIVPYDLGFGAEESQKVCPASIMLYVARTGKPFYNSSKLSRMRQDPFYGSRQPRTIICLPISNQGVQSGVILLSSMTAESPQARSAHSREIISCLGTFAILILSKHTFTQRLKNEVAERTKELTNALQAKTVFLSQCSHELRSPLSAVLGLASVLEASPGLSAVQREHLRTILSSGEDLLGLINNILDHSRLESRSVVLERIPFSLREVIETALDSLAFVAQGKGLDVGLISPFVTDPPELIGDPFRVKQVLINLLSNAIKFTSTGYVTVRWETSDLPGNRIHIRLFVSDTGLGIPAHKMDKLFKSFSQVDESITRSFGGSGLGLIISKNLAKLLDGDCTATSELGKGSVFEFSFVCDKDSSSQVKYEMVQKKRECYVLCPNGPSWDILWAVLAPNLISLNCDPIRFSDSVEQCLVEGFPSGLNSKKTYDVILVETRIVSASVLKQMQRLQPDAKFVYFVRSVDLTRIIREYNISRESIVARPIKWISLYHAFTDGSKPIKSTVKPRSRIANKELAKMCPLEILLVDDNVVNLTVGKRILEMFSYRNIDTACDGQQAIEASEKKRYDLILMDLQMPVLDGFSAQERIRASPLARDPSVVALTANADAATQQQCLEANFFDYISKPLNIPKLETILGNVYKYREERGVLTSST